MVLKHVVCGGGVTYGLGYAGGEKGRRHVMVARLFEKGDGRWLAIVMIWMSPDFNSPFLSGFRQPC